MMVIQELAMDSDSDEKLALVMYETAVTSQMVKFAVTGTTIRKV